MPYQVADGWDNEVSLVTLTPQPKSLPIQPGRLRVNGLGITDEDGRPTQTWVFVDVLVYADYEIVMTQAGLLTVRSAMKTIRTRQNEDSDFANYNAILTRIDGKDRHQVGGYVGVAIEVTGMIAL